MSVSNTRTLNAIAIRFMGLLFLLFTWLLTKASVATPLDSQSCYSPSPITGLKSRGKDGWLTSDMVRVRRRQRSSSSCPFTGPVKISRQRRRGGRA